jgi:alpha-L-fucosidase
MKSLKQCLQTLVLCAGGGGNLLFNVGPRPDGTIEKPQVERLKEMGDWLAKYGNTIYETRGGPWMPDNNVASTRRGNAIYLHILLYPGGGGLVLPAIPRRIVGATVLTGGNARVTQTATRVGLQVKPPSPPVSSHGAEMLARRPSARSLTDEIDVIVRLDLDGSAMDIPVTPTALPSALQPAASKIQE